MFLVVLYNGERVRLCCLGKCRGYREGYVEEKRHHVLTMLKSKGISFEVRTSLVKTTCACASETGS